MREWNKNSWGTVSLANDWRALGPRVAKKLEIL